MKKTEIKILSAILCVLLVVTLAGCSKTAAPPASPSDISPSVVSPIDAVDNNVSFDTSMLVGKWDEEDASEGQMNSWYPRSYEFRDDGKGRLMAFGDYGYEHNITGYSINNGELTYEWVDETEWVGETWVDAFGSRSGTITMKIEWEDKDTIVLTYYQGKTNILVLADGETSPRAGGKIVTYQGGEFLTYRYKRV